MAKSRKIGGIYAELTLKDTKFQKGLKAAAAKVNKFGIRMAKAGAVAAGAMAAGLTAGTKKMITMGAELDHMSTQTGVAVSSLIKIGQAYKDNGKAADTAGKDINKMQRAIYEASQDPGGSMDYFAQIGLSAEELMGMNPEQQFFAIGNALLKIQNQTEQTAVAMDIFGRSGAEVLKVFKGTTLDDVNASLGRMPEIMDQFSGAMERVDTLMGRLPNKSDQFFAGFTSGIVGQILPGLESINDKDFTTLGESLGDAVGEGMQLLTDGSIWEIFALHAEKAFYQIRNSDAINGFFAHVTALSANIGDVLKNSLNVGSMLAGGPAPFDADMSGYQQTLDRTYNFLKSADDARISGIQSDIDAIMAANRRESKAKKSAAAMIGADVYGPELPPVIAPIIDAITAPTAQNDARNWESSSYSVNSMQARGLGMGGENVASQANKQITLLERMTKVLERAETNGGLKWA